MLSRAFKRPWDGRRPRDVWPKARGRLAKGQGTAGRRPGDGWPKARGDFDAFKGFLKAMGWMKATGCVAEGHGTAGRRPQDSWPKARGRLAECQG